MTETSTHRPQRLPALLRFIVPIFIGVALGAGTFYGFFGGHVEDAGVAAFIGAIAVMTVSVGLATWFWKWAGGAGMTVGLAFGYTPVFGVWARDHMTGLWATWMIMALGGMLLYGLLVITVVWALDIKVRGHHPEDSSAWLDLPDDVRVARRHAARVGEQTPSAADDEQRF